MESIETKLFVYGTLRSECNNAAYQYVTNNFSLIGPARVRGRLYDLGSFPGAVKSQNNSFIFGELYELKEFCQLEQAFIELDDYEGINLAEEGEQLYIREVTDVLYNGLLSKAWIYWFNQDVFEYELLPSGNYLDYFTYNF